MFYGPPKAEIDSIHYTPQKKRFDENTGKKFELTHKISMEQLHKKVHEKLKASIYFGAQATRFLVDRLLHMENIYKEVRKCKSMTNLKSAQKASDWVCEPVFVHRLIVVRIWLIDQAT